jgi:hypothetical protein
VVISVLFYPFFLLFALHSGASEFFILNQPDERPEPEFKSWDKLP